MRESNTLSKVNYDDFMNIMLDRISKSRTSKKGILFESGKIHLFIETSNVTCFICPVNRSED